jgi:hypothetical protein
MLGGQQIWTARDVVQKGNCLRSKGSILFKVLEMFGHPMSTKENRQTKTFSDTSEHYLNTFNTRIVAGELTTDSFRFLASTSGGSSRGLEEAEVAIANAAAAVDVLLLEHEHIHFVVIAFLDKVRCLVRGGKTTRDLVLNK